MTLYFPPIFQNAFGLAYALYFAIFFRIPFGLTYELHFAIFLRMHFGLAYTLCFCHIFQNAFWFALGWGLFFFIPVIIVGVKLSKFYRKMNEDEGYVE